MELLQACVDCSVIALWLGHDLIETTQTYQHAHLALKEAACSQNRSAWFGGRQRIDGFVWSDDLIQPVAWISDPTAFPP